MSDLVIGRRMDGRMFTLPPVGSIPHMLIAGKTGGGKSVRDQPGFVKVESKNQHFPTLACFPAVRLCEYNCGIPNSEKES